MEIMIFMCVVMGFSFMHCYCMDNASIHDNCRKRSTYLTACGAHMTGSPCRGHLDNQADLPELYQWSNHQIVLLSRSARQNLAKRNYRLWFYYLKHVSFLEGYLQLTCSLISGCSSGYEYNMAAAERMVKLMHYLQASVFYYRQYQSICFYLENFLMIPSLADDTRAQCLYGEFSEKIKYMGFDAEIPSESIIRRLVHRYSKSECLELMHLYGTRAWCAVADGGNCAVQDLLMEYSRVHPVHEPIPRGCKKLL